jgi:hypothetical protein
MRLHAGTHINMTFGVLSIMLQATHTYIHICTQFNITGHPCGGTCENLSCINFAESSKYLGCDAESLGRWFLTFQTTANTQELLPLRWLFFMDQLPLKIKVNIVFENIRTTHPPTQSCIPEDLNPQQHNCEYVNQLVTSISGMGIAQLLMVSEKELG